MPLSLTEHYALIDATIPDNITGAIDPGDLRRINKELALMVRDYANSVGGWSPVLALKSDGPRIVAQVVDWINGTPESIKPAAGAYLSETGYSNNVGLAVNLRGPIGPVGPNSPGGLFFYTQAGDPVEQWVPILTLPAQTEGTFDAAAVTAVMGTWTDPRQTVRLQLGQRGGLWNFYSSEGPRAVGVSLEIYHNADNSATLYARLDHVFKTITVQVPLYTPNQVAVYGSLVPLPGAAPGVRVFTTADPASYPPTRQTWANFLPLWNLGNTSGSYPPNHINDVGGPNALAIGSNNNSGQRDLSLINANLGGNGFGFHQQIGANTGRLLAMLTAEGKLGVNHPIPAETLHVNGNARIEGTVIFPDVVSNRKLVLHGGSGSNTSEHQFYGVGINASMLRYQVDAPSAQHAWFAGESPASSKELMRLIGIGNLGIGTSTPDRARLHLKGPTGAQQLCLETPYSPTGTNDPAGAVGNWCWDAAHMYVKTPTGWKRNDINNF